MNEHDQTAPATEDSAASPLSAQAMTLSQEVAHVGTEWTESGRIRLRRRIVTETRTIQVQVRREELIVDTHDVDVDHGVLRGTRLDGPRTAAPSEQPPLVIVLQEEIPEVQLRLTPYQIVTVTKTLAAATSELHTSLRHEELELERFGSSDTIPRSR